MEQKTYKVVFSGEIVKGLDVDTVKQNLRVRFKFDDQTLDKLFTGENVTIRKRLDLEKAQKYVSAFRLAGAVCSIKERSPKPERQQAQIQNTFLFDSAEPKTILIDPSEDSLTRYNNNSLHTLHHAVNHTTDTNDDTPSTLPLNQQNQTDSHPRFTLLDKTLPLETPPLEEDMSCPKCGFLQKKTDMCERCGVIFAKYNPQIAFSNSYNSKPEQSESAVNIYTDYPGINKRSTRSRRKSGILQASLDFIINLFHDWFRGNIYIGLMLLVLLPVFGSGLIINAVFYTQDHHVLYEFTDQKLACGNLYGDPNTQSTYVLMDNYQKDYMLTSFVERENLRKLKGDIFCVVEHQFDIGNIGDETVNSITLTFDPEKFTDITLDEKTGNHIRYRFLNISEDNAREKNPDIERNNNTVLISNIDSGALIKFKLVGWYAPGEKQYALKELLQDVKISEGTIEEGSPRATTFARFVSAIF